MDQVGVKNAPDGLTVGVQAAEPTEPFGKNFYSLPPGFGVHCVMVRHVAKMQVFDQWYIPG
jgi:hypothetical protein